MGDDNEDMEGFRIWKTGYWQQFLRGQPYHTLWALSNVKYIFMLIL